MEHELLLTKSILQQTVTNDLLIRTSLALGKLSTLAFRNMDRFQLLVVAIWEYGIVAAEAAQSAAALCSSGGYGACS